jgi:hypothetical protein
MEYAIELGSGELMYIPIFVGMGSGALNLIWGTNKYTIHKCTNFNLIYVHSFKKIPLLLHKIIH